LLHLSNLSQRSFGHSKYIYGGLYTSSRRCIGRLVSTVHWASRLSGALDVSDMVWTSSKGPKESYKCDLANLLVSLIALSYDHQNHSKWPKWGHVRYSRYGLTMIPHWSLVPPQPVTAMSPLLVALLLRYHYTFLPIFAPPSGRRLLIMLQMCEGSPLPSGRRPAKKGSGTPPARGDEHQTHRTTGEKVPSSRYETGVASTERAHEAARFNNGNCSTRCYFIPAFCGYILQHPIQIPM